MGPRAGAILRQQNPERASTVTSPMTKFPLLRVGFADRFRDTLHGSPEPSRRQRAFQKATVRDRFFFFFFLKRHEACLQCKELKRCGSPFPWMQIKSDQSDDLSIFTLVHLPFPSFFDKPSFCVFPS